MIRRSLLRGDATYSILLKGILRRSQVCRMLVDRDTSRARAGGSVPRGDLNEDTLLIVSACLFRLLPGVS